LHEGATFTLVVQTNGPRDDLWLDMAGDPLTDAATLTERLRRPDFGTLQVAFTVNDPKPARGRGPFSSTRHSWRTRI
jgi:hypothetical protein